MFSIAGAPTQPAAKYKSHYDPILRMDRLAWYGPADRYQLPPGGGMCISVFAIVRESDKVLVGLPERHERWSSEWIPAWRSYPKEDYDDVFRQWRLPSGYLREGEHPDACVNRVMCEQVGLEKFDVAPARVLSYTSPSDWYPGKDHWDLVFAYDVSLRQSIKRVPWWKELRFMGRAELESARFGWNEDLMRDLKLVDPRDAG
jgi:ADP-ribose pyrophosphatase YjhB (NUDIX family)